MVAEQIKGEIVGLVGTADGQVGGRSVGGSPALQVLGGAGAQGQLAVGEPEGGIVGSEQS